VAVTVRTAAEIRDALLSYWSAEYLANGENLLTAPGSDAYLMASMIAIVQNACDVQALQVSRDILPDQASNGAIERFGYVYGIARQTAVAARLTVTVTGTPSATITIPVGSALAWTDGTLYRCTSTSVTLSGGGSGTINVTATTTGLTTTRAVGDVLTWQSAPAGLNPTGTVAGITTAGDDAESYQDWALRIIGRLRERPASGNRADWAAWVEAYTALDIVSVYVYPLTQPLTGAAVLGCVTVVAVGPAQGDSITNTRILGVGNVPGATLTEVHDYIEGTRTADGLVTATGTQLRPVTMSAGDYTVDAIDVAPQSVVMSVTPNSANAYAFGFTATIDASSTATSLVLVGNYTTGASNLANTPVLVDVGNTYYRGGYYRIVLPAGVFAAGNTTFDLTAAPLPAAPTGTLYPPPGNWSDLRTAIFAYFDSLGPGDTTPPRRWPSEDNGARATVYRSALVAAAMAVPGVLSASVTTPGTDVAPLARQVVTLGNFLVVP